MLTGGRAAINRGVSDFPDFSKKWLQALKETVPHFSTVGVLWDPTTGRHQRQAVEAAAAELSLKVTVSEVRLRDDIERALQSAVSQGASGLVALSSPIIGGSTKLLAELSLKYHLPAITLFTDFAREVD